MDLVESCRVLIIMLLLLSLSSEASGQSCTSGYQDILNDDITARTRKQRTLVPLLRKEERDYEQWIFPTMQFTCRERVTGWIFRGLPGLNVTNACRVVLTTWRRSGESRTSSFRLKSTTERNVAKITVDDENSLFTYELVRPVSVREGDVGGIEMGRDCRPQDGDDFDNILSVNVSRKKSITTTSYRRESSGAEFDLESLLVFTQNDIIPLVMPVIGNSQKKPSVVSMSSTATPSTSDQSDSEGGVSQIVAITAGTIGGTVGIVILAAMCFGAVWISRHLHEHVRKSNSTNINRRDHHISREVFVQPNVAYRMPPSDWRGQPAVWAADDITGEQDMSINPLYGRTLGSHDESHDQVQNESEGRMMVSRNIAYRQGNLRQGEVANPRWQGPFAVHGMSTGQNLLISSNTDHTYESVTCT